ncbi:MAG: DUF4956 domain-containing protein [Bacteroidia bacterium]|jgi:hypothetical protein|nr:DUF4956 domain-containing protein [Bacteroidia bacterium]
MTRTLLNWLFPVLLLLFASPQEALAQQTPPVGENGLFLSTDSTTESDQESKDEKKKKKKEKEEEAAFFSFGLDRFDITFFTRMLVNILSMIILIRFIYYPVYKKRDYFFTFFMFNITIFVITFLLNTKTSFSTGAAFGLFAVFSLLRYRTEDISARDMTYLFTVIALGLISSVNKGNVLEIIIVNSTILLAAFLLDGNILMKTEFVKTIQYENIELIKPDNHTALIEDLKKRTGLNIHKVSIGRVDFLRDTAVVKIYYYENRNQEV